MPTASLGDVDRLTVKSSRGDRFYLVTLLGGRPVACTCPGFEYRGEEHGTDACRHLRDRTGPDAVGTTKCASCMAFLSVEEIEAQPWGDPRLKRRGRLCDHCARFVQEQPQTQQDG